MTRGALHFLSGKSLEILNCDATRVKSRLLDLEQSNTSVLHTYLDNEEKEHDFFFKLYRKLEYGLNPELELVRLAIPRRTYSLNHMKYIAAVLKNVYDSRNEAKSGYTIIDEAPIMRHFTVKFEKIL